MEAAWTLPAKVMLSAPFFRLWELYEMKLFGTIMVLSATFCMNGCAESEKRAIPKLTVATVAKTKSELVEGTQEQIRILRTELAGIRRELSALRRDVAKVLSAGAKRPPDTTIYDIAPGSSPVLGRPDAPVVIVEFADFQCPFCIREYPKLKAIMKAYPDKVKVVFKHFPLGSHKKAKPVHAAAELARIQGGSELFWKMHDKIMAKPGKLDVSDLREYAKSLNMDLEKFDEYLADESKINGLLRADITEAQKCKVRGTPTVFINGLKLTDRTINGYKARIDRILAKRALPDVKG